LCLSYLIIFFVFEKKNKIFNKYNLNICLLVVGRGGPTSGLGGAKARGFPPKKKKNS